LLASPGSRSAIRLGMVAAVQNNFRRNAALHRITHIILQCKIEYLRLRGWFDLHCVNHS
jgi:hypothetical protein